MTYGHSGDAPVAEALSEDLRTGTTLIANGDVTWAQAADPGGSANIPLRGGGREMPTLAHAPIARKIERAVVQSDHQFSRDDHTLQHDLFRPPDTRGNAVPVEAL